MTEQMEWNSEIKLSARLRLIANQVPRGGKLADIGSDHALLPVYLAQRGIVASAIAGELNDGPFRAARKQVGIAGFAHTIAVRQGDGLSVLGSHEVDTVVIAGMGGSTITAIVEQGLDRLNGVSRLILQPNVGEALVRAWLLKRGWLLEDEHIVEEDGVIYEVLVARPEAGAEDKAAHERLYAFVAQSANTPPLDRELLLLLGPHQLRKAGATFMNKWERELDKRRRIISQLAQSSLDEARSKRLALEEEVHAIRRVLDCLQTGNLLFS